MPQTNSATLMPLSQCELATYLHPIHIHITINNNFDYYCCQFTIRESAHPSPKYSTSTHISKACFTTSWKHAMINYYCNSKLYNVRHTLVYHTDQLQFSFFRYYYSNDHANQATHC